jgi:glycosyltransferase involved in cell wall biosynthesis
MVPETIAAFKSFPQAHLVAISHMSQRASGIDMPVVHNSVDTNLFVPDAAAPKDYLLCVGRMSKARDVQGNFMDPKGIGNAIAVAQKSGLHLKIVGNVEDPAFFETIVKPHLSDSIEFVGEVSAEQKLTRQEMATLFAGALAFINPINWEEPFGLVMAEALASGTPVVAFGRGAVSEIVENGKVGFVVDPAKGIDGLVEAVGKIAQIDRKVCRDHAVAHFSTERMVGEYEKVYEKVISTFKGL